VNRRIEQIALLAESLDGIIRGRTFGEELLRKIAATLCTTLELDRVLIGWAKNKELLQAVSDRSGAADNYRTPFIFRDGRLFVQEREISLPVYMADISRSIRDRPTLVHFLESKIQSAALLPLRLGAELYGWIELHQTHQFRRWHEEERLKLEEVALVCALGLSRASETQAVAQVETLEQSTNASLAARYERLLQFSGTLAVSTDPNFCVREVLGDVDALLGIPADFLHTLRKASSSSSEDNSIWTALLLPKDLARLGPFMQRLRSRPRRFQMTLRLMNQRDGSRKWFLVRCFPLFDADQKVSGWEAIAIENTAEHEAQELLQVQSKRIEALYEVSRALQLNLDPSIVMLKGLRALLGATNSDSGLGFAYGRENGVLELVAAERVSSEYIEALERTINGPSLVRHVVETREGVLIDDIQKDTRAVVRVAEMENLHATIIVPLLFEERCLGALVLFCKEVGRYSTSDFELVKAAASQVALATYQAELYANERRQASLFAILYRLSHELSNYLHTKDIARHAFSILHEELASKRMWLGLINEHGSHLIGQAGFGPGIRKRLSEVQLDLKQRHDFLDEALRTKRPMVVYPSAEMECSGLNLFMKKLRLGPFAIVPLVSLGKVVGVLMIEPTVAAGFFAPGRLSLLSTVGSEIATIMLARRFETRVAEADKMRMAGLLASGVAHNFNNILQAVMGQSSLLELQLPHESSALRSAQTIKTAAERGAALVRQLLNFSRSEAVAPAQMSVATLLKDSQELYASVLGPSIQLDIFTEEELPEIIGDGPQIQQVVTNLVVNARDALEGASMGVVHVSAQAVQLKSGEIGPELSPGAYVRINVEDNGIGMHPEELARCFEPFFTTKNVDPLTGIGVGGTGLGLSSAYSIIRKHDGLITVQSKPGKGTLFSIYLPAVERKVELAEARSAKPALLVKPQVLLMGLNEGLIHSTRAILEPLGLMAVRTAERTITEKLIDEVEEVDVLIIHPEGTEGELPLGITELRRRRPNVKVLLMTGDRSHWLGIVKDLDEVEVLEGSLGSGWALHQTALKLLKQRLSQGIEIQRVPENRNGSSGASFAAPSSDKVDTKGRLS
jgi:signal transduction histidine kinase